MLLRGWNLDATMAFRGGAFGIRPLGWSPMTVPCWLYRRGMETRHTDRGKCNSYLLLKVMICAKTLPARSHLYFSLPLSLSLSLVFTPSIIPLPSQVETHFLKSLNCLLLHPLNNPTVKLTESDFLVNPLLSPHSFPWLSVSCESWSLFSSGLCDIELSWILFPPLFTPSPPPVRVAHPPLAL
jgi:hypothetical protein